MKLKDLIIELEEPIRLLNNKRKQMKVFLNVKDYDMIELQIPTGNVDFISRKDIININKQSYIVNNKSIYFTTNNTIDYVALNVEKI